MDDKRNILMAAILTVLILFGWPYVARYVFPPANPPVTKIEGGKTVALPQPGPTGVSTPAKLRDRATVLRESSHMRIAIETPKLRGSINLSGARIDDIVLPGYRESIAKNAPPIRLYSPSGTPDAYFAGFGWTGNGLKVPDAGTPWTAEGAKLTQTTPVTLGWNNGQGQTFRIRLTVDANYMIAAEQSVINAGTGPVAVKPFAYIRRDGVSKDLDGWQIHTGPIGVFNGSANYDVNFETLDEEGIQNFSSTDGWLGFTDLYWLSALIPDQKQAFQADLRTVGSKQYQADLTTAPEIVVPGKAVSQTTRLFVGAKETITLRNYVAAGVPMLDYAIDWGWFRWFEIPIFYLLNWLYEHIGNFGLAIISLTFIVRLIMFPIAQRQFASMAAMRAIQPKMKAIQEKYKDDRPKQQQEIMALYKAEKVNPLAGCLPIFLQIPIFFALYKVLMLAIEMRHKPFVLWIKDLSVPDPLHLLNLFGLLDFTVPMYLSVGVLAILLGISMWLQFRLNPAPMDDMQKQIFAIMPWMMMFIMAPFAAGLLVYWITSNLLTIAQQAWLYSRHPALKVAAAK